MKGLCFELVHSSRLVGTRSTRSFSYQFHRKNHQAFLSFPKLVVPSPCSQRCLASMSPVVAEVEEKKTFDSEAAGLLVKELRKTFNSGRTKNYEWRMIQLSSIARMLDEKEKDILEALYKDLSKPELEAFISEISTAKGSCKEAMEGLKQWMIPQKVKTLITTYPSSAEIVSEPLGVVLVISTWNFPFLLSIDPVIGAISAGNAVVLKPSEIAPATSSLLARLVEEYLDSSAVKVVEGAIPETTALLEQKWDKILYTGSARVGRIVLAAAAKHLTPVNLELGGKSPAVVDSNVDLQVAVRRIIAGKWACNNGQACIGVDYIITTKDFAPKLIEGIKYGLEQFFGKDPMNSKDISRIVSLTQFARLVKLLEEDKVSDKIVLGGQTDENQLKIAPTILLDVPEDTQIMNEEIFGPLMPIVTVVKIEGSFDVINSTPKPLAAYLFTNNEQLKGGMLQCFWVNLGTSEITLFCQSFLQMKSTETSLRNHTAFSSASHFLRLLLLLCGQSNPTTQTTHTTTMWASHYLSPPPPLHPRLAPLPLTVVSAKSQSQPDQEDFGGLGRSILTQLKSNSKPTNVTAVPKQQKQKREETSRQISGSEVLFAMQKAAAKKRKEAQKKKKTKTVAEGLPSAGRYREVEEDGVENSKVRPLCLNSDWGRRLDELEMRLQELSSKSI